MQNIKNREQQANILRIENYGLNVLRIRKKVKTKLKKYKS